MITPTPDPIIGSVPIGTTVEITDPRCMYAGQVVTVAWTNGPTGGTGGGGTVRIESPMGGVVGTVTRYTRVRPVA